MLLRYNRFLSRQTSPLGGWRAAWEHDGLYGRAMRMVVRVRGQIGQWPVDLSIELDAADWQQLAAHLPSVTGSVTASAPVSGNAEAPVQDGLWQTTLDLLRQAGQVEGPQLLSQLAALAGGELAGKRLLVRLRHCSQVRVETGADAPVYHWQG
jgi:hypothetical protein